MAKILLGGAGGVPTENVVRSLQEGDPTQELIGMGSEAVDLSLSSTTRKYFVPYAVDANYKNVLIAILKEEKPDLSHFQNDIEIREISRMREDVLAMGCKLFMPSKETIEICVDKSRSTEIWMREGVRVPKTMLINTPTDLKKAFDTLANKEGKIWIRATEGGGGRGALPTDNYDFAKMWIDRYKGWESFTAAQLLDTKTVTWLSIWHEGNLVVAQARRRHSWNMGNRTLSGVTGVTQIGETVRDEQVDRIALDAIQSIDKKPHGIYGVDMAYDFENIPNPTEINISRFFTTVYFFTKAGLNMPQIFADIALRDKFPTLERKINPLPEGLLWVRSMDRAPLLTTKGEIEDNLINNVGN